MQYAFMGKILRVNLSTGEITSEDLREDWARKFIGGAGLATRYHYEEVPAGVDPLGPENKLIFMTGPLTGTTSPSGSRYSVVAKSPQTGLWGQSNSGGSFGPALKRSGYDGIIFEGTSPNPVYLKIVQGSAELCDASFLWGKNVPETDDLLQETSSNKYTVACIGPAGENLVRYAAIMNNKHRAAGRCGLGAVMGSKHLKAIACSGNTPPLIADGKNFRTFTKQQIDYLNESMLKVGFDAFGTNMLSDMVNVRGGYPTCNWQEGVFDDIEDINAQALTDKVLIRGINCFACPVSCGRDTKISEGKWSNNRGEGPEYESTNTLGALCGVADINAITMANYRCNEYGLDTISAGASIAFAMECFQRGILTSAQTDGRDLLFGDADLVVDLIEKIAKREGIGDLLAEGTRVMSQKLGAGSEHFAMHVKGLELPAYDPRAAKITGLGYVTANRGGDHITGYIQGPTFIDLPFLIVDESFIKDPFVANPQEATVLIDMENALTALDALGACKFMGVLVTAQDIATMVAAAIGWDFSVEEFRTAGERIYNLTRAYCVREGVNRSMDTLPERLFTDPLPDGPAEGMVVEQDMLETLKDAYYEYRGWDKTTGIPTVEKLVALGLDELVKDLVKS